MKNLLLLILLFFGAYTISSQTKQEVKKEILKLRKQGDNLDKDLNDGFYCKKYFIEWHNFNYRKLYTYPPPKTVAEVESIITKYQNDIAFLENLKKDYNRPNGALSIYNSDASKMNALLESLRELEKSIDENPYPLTWKYKGNCKNVIESINNKIRTLNGFLTSKQGLKKELENNSSKNSKSTNKTSKNNSYNSSKSNTTNTNSNNTRNNNSLNKEIEAERLKREEKEKGEEILRKGQENIDRIKQNSDEIGNEITKMFSNGISPKGFYNMSESFYSLDSRTGNIAGSASKLVGVGVNIINALKAEKSDRIRSFLNSIENSPALLKKEYENLNKYAKSNNYNLLSETNEKINKTEYKMINVLSALSKLVDKEKAVNYENSSNNIKMNYLKRINVFQDLETKKLIKKIYDKELNIEEIIIEYLKLSHTEFIKLSRSYFQYESINKKFSFSQINMEFTSHLTKGRKDRIDKILKIFKSSFYENLKYQLFLTEESNGTDIRNCEYCNSKEKGFIKKLSTYFNGLMYEKQKKIIEMTLYRTVPSLELKPKFKYKKSYYYKGCYYPMSLITGLLGNDFKTNLFMAIYSPYQKREIPLYEAILERNKKVESQKIIKSLVIKKIKKEISENNQSKEKLFELRKHLTQKDVENI